MTRASGTGTRPRFSVVVPVRDGAAAIGATVRSVLAQHGPDGDTALAADDIEVVVVDDGSVDGTLDALRRAVTDARVVAVRQDNAGVAAARNAGARRASGEWLTFVDCDDEVRRDWLARFAALTAEDVGVVFGGCERREPGRPPKRLAPRPSGPSGDDRVTAWFPGTFAIRRELFLACGGYAVPLRFSENSELGLRVADALADTGLATATHDEPTYAWHVPPGSSSRAWSDDARLESALYIVAHHRRRLERDPDLLASYQAIAGVAAARLGRSRTARQQFARALRARPGDPRQWLRLLVSFVAPLRRRRWPPTRHGLTATADTIARPTDDEVRDDVQGRGAAETGTQGTT